MGVVHSGERNPNWRGGRITTDDGYIMIRVGVDHHLSDCRGYAYEHRLIAEKVLGRRLLPDEEIHHNDENKSNNEPWNLIIANGHAEHFVFHRKPGSNKKMPNQPNEEISCKCGCGAIFLKYDESNRPREYISGHNPPPIAETMNAIFESLKNGPKNRLVIAKELNKPISPIATALSKMKKKNLIEQVSHGIWKRK